MNFYTGIHSFYCGVDLHARSMYLCILDDRGQTVLHKNIRTDPQAFLRAVAPYRQGLIVAVECVFCWYWLADLCRDEGIDFLLGHAPYMKAVHGGKIKNDRLDSHKIASLVRGGNFPLAYTYPPEWRPTRDLLRRRNHLMRKRAELLAHIQNTVTQYNLPVIGQGALDAGTQAGPSGRRCAWDTGAVELTRIDWTSAPDPHGWMRCIRVAADL